jgi:ElaB/YqjD/DUF883 family membrane-anchored ribosome-binding protein
MKMERVLNILNEIKKIKWTTEELEYLAQEVDALFWNHASNSSNEVDQIQNLTMGILLERIERVEKRVDGLEHKQEGPRTKG